MPEFGPQNPAPGLIFCVDFEFEVKHFCTQRLKNKKPYQRKFVFFRGVPRVKYNTVFDEESESEVETLEILHPDLEIKEIIPAKDPNRGSFLNSCSYSCLCTG